MSGTPTPNDWLQLETMIDRLLDAPPDQRAAILDELTGGNAARRAELERLVAECEQSFTLLERPVAERFAALLESELMRVPAILAERYRVVRELGRGGMAVVYLAHDLKHERDVAVKIVRPELTATLGRARFLREIAIAAKLKHPHIVPLFDSGEQDGLLYYVMPYQEEQSLRERLKRDGSLPIDDTIAILSDVCDALAYAHQQGVVHRDIKPDNILLSGRHALVTDFGVARAVSAAADQETLTTAGSIVGTAAYMAPEQVAPHANTDHRVDIYAVGVMAYEMLAGQRPFSGDTPPSQRPVHSATAAIDLTRLREEVPQTLAALVMKCMATQPADRYQRAEDVLVELDNLGSSSKRRPAGSAPRRSWLTRAAIVVGAAGAAGLLWLTLPNGRGTAVVRPPPRLAVLVIQHGTDDMLEPLSMGLTDNLIAALGDAGLVVRSLNAVLPFRDGRTQIDSLARLLDVNWLVGGRLYRRGGQTVATVALSDASGRQVAQISVPAPFGDDVRLIEDLIPKVVALLRERMGDEVRLEGWRAGTRSDVAFAGVNRADREVRDARFLASAGDASGALTRLHTADSALEVSVRADPRWVEPHVQRAWVARDKAFILAGSGLLPDSIPVETQRSVAHAEAAVQMKPSEPRALEVLGIVLYTRSVLAAPKDSTATLLARAETLLRQASEADTTRVKALNTLSLIHYDRGEYEQASMYAAKAYAADAYSEDAQQLLARLFTANFEDGEDVEAREWCGEYRRVFPRDWFGGYCRLMLMMWDSTESPHPDTARRVMQAATANAPELIRGIVGAQLEMLVAGVFARTGPPGAAERALTAVHARIRTDSSIAREPHQSGLLLLEASVYARLDQPNAAITRLREYVRRRPQDKITLAKSRRFKDLPIERLRDASRNPQLLR